MQTAARAGPRSNRASRRWALGDVDSLNSAGSRMKVRLREWRRAVPVKPSSQVLVQGDEAVPHHRCCSRQPWDRHPALSPTDMVSMKVENSDRIYNIEFKVLGG